LGFRFRGYELRVYGAGCRVWGLGLKVLGVLDYGSGLKVRDLGFVVWC